MVYWGDHFSGSLPATRLAVQDMDPLLLTFLRASIAGLLAIALLVGFRQKRPRLAQLVPDHRLIRGGARLSATHGAGPAAHHLGAFDCVYWPAAADDRPLWRTARRRTPAAGFLDLFAAGQPAGGGIRPDAKCGGLTQRRSADAGGGYRLRPRLCGRAKLTRELGGWQVICWALVIALPLMLPASLLVQPASRHAISASSGRARLCVAVQHADRFHLLVQGLAAGGSPPSASSSIQPFFGLGLSARCCTKPSAP